MKIRSMFGELFYTADRRTYRYENNNS